MIKQIWKFKVSGSIQIPMDSQILTVQIQNDEPYIWVKVNPENDVETRTFEVVGTGHSFDDTNMKYIGTFQDGPFVWHLFENLN